MVVVGANDLARFVPPAQAAASSPRRSTALRARGTDVVVVPRRTCPAVPFVPPGVPGRRAGGVAQLQRRQAAAAEAAGGHVAAVARGQPGLRRRPGLFAADRFHPSSAGYARIAAALAPAVLAAARSRRDGAAA